MLDWLKDTQSSPAKLVQCCVSSGKAMPGSGAQERPSKLATNIEKGGKRCKSHYFTIFVTDCRHFLGKLRWY